MGAWIILVLAVVIGILLVQLYLWWRQHVTFKEHERKSDRVLYVLSSNDEANRLTIEEIRKLGEKIDDLRGSLKKPPNDGERVEALEILADVQGRGR